MTTEAVLCYIRDRGRVLLQRKAEGRFGGGFWNAPGGKIIDGESPEQAAAREVQEETSLTVRDLADHGTLTFFLRGIDEPDIHVRIFVAGGFEGTVEANDEGPLEWIPDDALPYDEMWEDDRLWVPHVLAGLRICASFRFSEGYGRLLEHEVRVEP